MIFSLRFFLTVVWVLSTNLAGVLAVYDSDLYPLTAKHLPSFLKLSCVTSTQKIFSEFYISKKQSLDEKKIAQGLTEDPLELIETLIQETPQSVSSPTPSLDLQETFEVLESPGEEELLKTEQETSCDHNQNVLWGTSENDFQAGEKILTHRHLEKSLSSCREKIKFFSRLEEFLEKFACAVETYPERFHFMDLEVFKSNLYAEPLSHLPYRAHFDEAHEFNRFRHFMEKHLRVRYVIGFESLSAYQQEKHLPLVMSVIRTFQKRSRFLNRLAIPESFVRGVQTQICTDFLRQKLSPERLQRAKQIVEDFLPLFLDTMKKIQEEARSKSHTDAHPLEDVLEEVGELKTSLQNLQKTLNG